MVRPSAPPPFHRRAPLCSLLPLAALALSCSTSSGSHATVEKPEVSVALTPSTARLLTGGTAALTAAVANADDRTVTWTATAGTVDADGHFTAPATVGPVTVTATSVADPTRSATATLSVVEVPLVTITTPTVAQSAVTKRSYVSGTISIDAQDGVTAAVSLGMKIKGRGNSTWSDPKKPYKVKLTGGAASLLGMPADKEWALLANYEDPTLIRNSVALELSRRLELAWTPRSRFVEVTWNGVYRGLYLLIETVRIAPDRVSVTETAEDDDSGEALTGGYLLERDARLDADDDEASFSTTRSEPFVVHEPSTEDVPDGGAARTAYIQGYVQTLEDALFGGDHTSATGYPAYLDVDSTVAYYLVNELSKNIDGTYSSWYLYKDRGAKLAMGPVWDFDRAFGNAANYECNTATGWFIQASEPPDRSTSSEWRSLYFLELFKDPAYAAAVRTRWAAVKAERIDTLGSYADELAAYLAHAQPRDQATWGTTSSYADGLATMKTFLSTRIAWIDANL